MKIIVDTNRIIAALVKDSASRKILLSGKFEFLTTGVTKYEIEKYKQEIMEKAQVTEEGFDQIFSLLYSRIFVVDDIVIESKMKEAKQTMDKIDPDDTPFIALALSVENDGIWSHDKHFEEQNKIRIWKTGFLLELLDENSE
ncbi:hypothetical protein HYU20_02450 [Candidatus Woesearchaeota archaeon]|nr:hypothetical protein [Candidatus Woesearchaeota archaeon]